MKTLTINYIKNPTGEACINAIKRWRVTQHIKKSINLFVVKTLFEHSENSDWDYYKNDYKYLENKFITKEQGLIMVQDDPGNINLLSRKVQIQIIELKPGLKRYIDPHYKNANNYWFN